MITNIEDLRRHQERTTAKPARPPTNFALRWRKTGGLTTLQEAVDRAFTELEARSKVYDRIWAKQQKREKVRQSEVA